MPGTLTDSRPPAPVAAPVPARAPSPVRSALRLPEARWALVATAAFGLGGAAEIAGAPAWLWWTLYLTCYATGGWDPGLAGLQALRRRSLDVDLLMIVAAVLAAGIGQVLDGALLIVIFATSGALEAIATQRTAASVQSLLTLAPEQATRLQAGDLEETVGTGELLPGDVLLIRPGERVGADAQVLDGLSEVDQASITGEPLPVLKRAGDPVFAGTLNGTGALRVRVDKAAGESVLARIVALVAEASATKAERQLFIERVEQRYSVAMVGVTLALLVVPVALGAGFRPTLLRAMTFMIVASPCAVVLATMPPLLAAIANAGRQGVLVKSAVVMEQLAGITQVAFDKTGTLTDGTPRIAAIRLVEHRAFALDQILTLAATAERHSEHPLARAVVAAATERGLELGTPEEFSSTPGRGVTATIAGTIVQVGSPAILNPANGTRAEASPAAAEVVDTIQAQGHTAVVVLIDHIPAAVLALVDRVRPQAGATVAALTRLTGNTPRLLTGDNAGAAGQLAAEVGIRDVAADLLPAAKAAKVRDLQAAGLRVLLVGDGVNDAPALAAADLGVAMGRAGSDLALETADAVIVRDDLAMLPTVIALSRRAHRVVVANLAIASAIITGLVIWDLVGHLPLPLGVAGHEGSTVLVGLNGLRLLRNGTWIPGRRAG
ncbi:MAG: cation-transporting P-type ATPase [Frankiales bacterium]|nr:cation-transporting P-type ATPase [Frankiales bacterium]